MFIRICLHIRVFILLFTSIELSESVLSFRIAFTLMFLFANGTVFAGTSVQAETNIIHQRNVFKTLERIASKPASAEFKRLSKQLKNYPLEPYIEQKSLMAYPYLANQQNIEKFLKEYEGTPLDWPLRKKWLQYLARKSQADAFISNFKSSSNAELTCQNLSFKLSKTPDSPELFEQITQLWLVGKSQPKECDGLFVAWQKAGYRTQDRVWQRLVLAADGGNHSLIPYLRKLLDNKYKYLADLWLKVRRSPSYVSRLSKFPGKHPDRELEILQYGLARLIWRDQELALKNWRAITRKFKVSTPLEQKVARKFAVVLALKNHDKARIWLQKVDHTKADEELYRWHLAYVLKQQNWQDVLELIDLAPPEIANEFSFQYWQARAFAGVNSKDNAQQRFDDLSKHRHYYGFLASAKISKKPLINDHPLEFTIEQLSLIANMPVAKRAYEFLQLERYTSARREWYYLQSQLNNEQKLISAVLANSWGWHDRAIFGFSNTGYLDDIKRRFPLAYSDQLLSQSSKHKIDPAWTFAIARRESSFMTDASSGAGAKGLMQLLPSTARYLAKKKIKTSLLYDPSTNAGYGTQYLSYLMKKMDNNSVLATASYNAGWKRVRQWLPDQGSMPIDIWIETIPYKETRNYVKAVLAYREIYATQLGQDSELFKDLANMKVDRKFLN